MKKLLLTHGLRGDDCDRREAYSRHVYERSACVASVA
jgi:hypothetical protein